MSKLRRIQPIVLPKTFKTNQIEPVPRIEEVFLHQLFVNEEYQRQIGARGQELIQRIAKDFQWQNYHVPVVTPCHIEDDSYDFPTYEILDGQHTCIGARTNGSIQKIPVMIVELATVEEKAKSFVGLNKNKVNVNPVQVFWAKVAANDELALEVLHGMEAGGGRIPRKAPPYGILRSGETICVDTLLTVAKKGGQAWVKRVFQAGVQCQLAPISASWIKVFETFLLEDNPLKIQGSHEECLQRLVVTIRSMDIEELEKRAKSHRNGSMYHQYLIEQIQANL